jgi:hypothetical protein
MVENCILLVVIWVGLWKDGRGGYAMEVMSVGGAVLPEEDNGVIYNLGLHASRENGV